MTQTCGLSSLPLMALNQCFVAILQELDVELVSSMMEMAPRHIVQHVLLTFADTAEQVHYAYLTAIPDNTSV